MNLADLTPETLCTCLLVKHETQKMYSNSELTLYRLESTQIAVLFIITKKLSLILVHPDDTIS